MSVFRPVTERQEKFSDSNVEFENRKEKPEANKIEDTEKSVVEKPRSLFCRLYWIIKILKVVEILILLALLSLTIYLLIITSLLTQLAGTLLIALFATYLFILCVDMICRISPRTLPDSTMVLFEVLGFLLFAAAAEGVYILPYRKKPDGLLLAVIILCVIEAILFFLDITLIVLNWRRAYMRVDNCPFGTPTSNVTTVSCRPGDNYSQRTVRAFDPVVFKGDGVDVTTSISNYERPSHPDLVNLHKYRKIGVGIRREYVDRSVDARSAISLNEIEVQTEPPEKKEAYDVETLIVADVREEPCQTVPRCPMCANNWDPQSGVVRRPDNVGLCPTFLHLTQGFGMCNCCQPTPAALGESIRRQKPNSITKSNHERK